MKVLLHYNYMIKIKIMIKSNQYNNNIKKVNKKLFNLSN